VIRKTANILFYVIAAFYIFMMIDLFFRFNYMFDTDRIVSRSYNLIPFKTIWGYASRNNHVSFADINILGNIVVFIPYGIYLGVIKKRKGFMISFVIVAATSLFIEITQFIFGLGACDIDDVILNTIGGIIGIIGYKLLRRVLKEESRTKTAITAISLIFGIPIIYLYFTTVFNHLRL